MRRVLLPFVLIVVLVGAAACTQEKTASPTAAAFDKSKFIATTLQSATADAALGAEAAKAAGKPEVRQLGEAMHREQEAIRAAAATLAQRNGVKPPPAPEEKKVALQQNLELLRQRPDLFDKGYVLGTVQALNADLKSFRDAATSSDPEARELAARYLPVIDARQKAASALLEKLGGSPFGYPP